LLALALANPAAAAASAPAIAADKAPATAKAGARLRQALERPPGPEGIAIGVALRGEGLPPLGAARRVAIQVRQQRVLDALSASDFRLKRRYVSVSGFAGWAQPAAIGALLNHPETAFVYLDGRVHATLAEGVGLIGANAAHAQGVTGSGIGVAVLDTGIDSDHPDLADDLGAQQCFCDTHPSPKFGCCPSGGQTEANAEDDEGHGTAVSGIITSSRVSAPGAAPDAEIVAVKVLDSGGGGTFSDVAAGLDWVLTNHISLGIRIVNMSLSDGGEYNNSSASPCAGTNTANAIQALHAAGVAVFASSGNDGHDQGISFPACVAEAVSVGGVYDAALGEVSWCGNATCTTILCTDNPTGADVFVCHSSSDELLDLLAPNWQTETAALGGGSVAFGGTSASSPYAAAQAALLLQADDSLTPEQIRTLMKTNGSAIVNPDNGLSFTRSDIGAALLAISPATCGNDVIENGEDCDDGNTADGDCCSSSCQYEPATTICRAAAGACDLPETCTGADGSCPPDEVLDGVPCPDGDLCNGDEICQTGVCVTGAPLACDDGDSCTADSCDEVNGCANTPIEPCGDIRLPTSSSWGRLLLGLLVLAAGAATSTSEARRTVREEATPAPQVPPE
jgi:cysteine-rich repeat protein